MYCVLYCNVDDMDGAWSVIKSSRNEGFWGGETHCLSANFLPRTFFFILLKNTFHKCTEHIIFASPLDISYNFIISVGTCLRAFEVTT